MRYATHRSDGSNPRLIYGYHALKNEWPRSAGCSPGTSVRTCVARLGTSRHSWSLVVTSFFLFWSINNGKAQGHVVEGYILGIINRITRCSPLDEALYPLQISPYQMNLRTFVYRYRYNVLDVLTPTMIRSDPCTALAALHATKIPNKCRRLCPKRYASNSDKCKIGNTMLVKNNDGILWQLWKDITFKCRGRENGLMLVLLNLLFPLPSLLLWDALLSTAWWLLQ